MIASVLVPHDLTDLSDAGLEALSLFAQQAQRGPPLRLHIVHVLPRIDPSAPGLVWPRDEDEARMEHARSALHARLRDTAFEHATIHVRIGDPGSRIVALADEIDAEMIVIPSHGRSGFSRMLLGSVAEHVARFARCPVLVLPAGALRRERERERDRAATASHRTAVRCDQVDRLGAEITERIRCTEDTLTALRIAIPPGDDPAWWEREVVARLADAGISFVDLVFAPHPEGASLPEVLDIRFEARFV